MKKIKDIFKNLKLQWRFGNRNVVKASFLYYYIIFGGAIGIVYAIVSVFITGLPFWIAFVPAIGLFAYFIGLFIVRNWKLFWLYLRDMDQGRLLIYLNERTHFQEKHKMNVVRWVYPRRNNIRNEKWVELGNKLRDGKTLSKEEKRQYSYKKVGCPQQLVDGFNQALLVDALIYAHRNIRTLDNEIRDIMFLTDENILSFNLQAEVNKCRTKESRDEIERLTRIGEKKIAEKKGK